jgi:fluoride exporter
MNWILIFVGGGIGSICRFGISNLMPSQPKIFPTATFITNLIASILIGFLVSYCVKNNDNTVKYLLITGFCGGFSTFSTFSFESYQLFNQGDFLWAALYIIASVVACLGGVYFGMKLLS